MANHLQDPITKPDQPFDEETVRLQAERIVSTVAFPMVLKAALELGVIDTIAAVDEGVWLSSSEIALRLPTKPTNPEAPALLDRMLLLLASHSILKYRMVETGENGQTERVYAAEPVCTLFLNRGDSSGSLASMLMLLLSEVYAKTWANLKDMILNGDMFTEIPKGDAIFMKWILHDWTDEDGVKILKNCWKSLSEKGKVIIVDMIIPVKPNIHDFSSNIVFSMDMLMLTQCSGGKERSFSQFETLASASGFVRCEIICHADSFCVIEIHK